MKLEELFVFMRVEERGTEQDAQPTKRRFTFVDKWLAAILKETAETIPPQPRIKTKAARAPPSLKKI